MNRYISVLCLLVTMYGPGAGTVQAFQGVALPRPEGPFGVGTTVRQWVDSTRLEGFTNDPYDQRRLDVYVWYPAALRSARSPTPYVPNIDETELVMGADYAAHVRNVRTNSTIEPALSRRPALFPVVVFSHGLGSLPMHYTVLAEELASQGYLVAAINHSFGSAATVLRSRGAQPLHEDWRAGFAISPEANRFWDDQITDWAADIVFVVNRLAAENDRATEFFGRRLDLSRVVTMGHSLGGSAALLAGQVDPRIKAVVNLDGAARNINARLPMPVPVFWMQRDRSMMDSVSAARNLRASRRVFRNFRQQLDANQDTLMSQAQPDSYVVSILRFHNNHFSDLPVAFGEPEGVVGFMDARRAVDIVRTYVVRFLAARMGQADVEELELLGRRFPEVRVLTVKNRP